MCLSDSYSMLPPTYGSSFPQPFLLHRVRGYALAQLGELPSAAAALEVSVQRAQLLRADYELALGLEGLAAVGRLQNQDVETIEEDCRAILERLGVAETARVPLPDLLGSNPR